jgi:hypothetical protein
MKTTIVAMFFLCVFCAATAGAQTGVAVLTNNAAPLQMTDHPQHASQHDMGRESTLLSTSQYGYVQGEVPLSELASPIYQTPLGDLARAIKKDRAATPKAVIVFEKQGEKKTE